MYLRRTSRTNRDGTVTSYLALAHNYRDPDTGVSKPKILHSFGREDELDPQVLERLTASIARHLDVAVPASDHDPAALELEPIDGRDLGGAWVLDRLWDRLGIGREIRRLARKPAHAPGRKLDVDLLERILFALVAGRALAPSSKLEATRWIREEVYIDGLAEVDHTTPPATGRWTGCSTSSRRCRRRCSSPWRTYSNLMWTSSSSTPPPPTSRPSSKTASSRAPATGYANVAIRRTRGLTCPRW